MAIITQATPNLVLEGIRDASVPVQPIVTEALPQHCPLFYVQAQRARREPLLLSGADLVRTLGGDTFDERSKWHSHAIAALQACNAEGNQAFVQTLYDVNAKEAVIALGVEVVELTFKPWQRNPDGSVVRDALGVKQEDTGGADQLGRLVRWVAIPADSTDYKTLTVNAGTLVGNGGATSTVYPILSMKADFFGEAGDNLGLRMFLPHGGNGQTGDVYAMNRNNALVLRMQMLERNATTGNQTVIETETGESFIDFSMFSGVRNDRTSQDYDITNILEAYRSDGLENGAIPRFGPFGDYFLYEANIDTLLDDLKTIEDTFAPAPIERNMINFMDGVDLNGYDYYGIRFDVATTLAMDPSSAHYATGGADGNVSEPVLGTLIQDDIAAGWDEPEFPKLDRAQYPISDVYDTGFDVDTKNALISVLGLREDVWVTVSTQDMAGPENSISQDYSAGVALRTRARLYPESIIHGTPCCRVTIVSGMGQYVDSQYKRRLPLMFDIMTKRARFAGASSGNLQVDEVYDRYPNNVLDKFVKLSNTWAPQVQRDQDFGAGINYPLYTERRELAWPIFQTVYDEAASVLNSEIFGRICCDLERQAHWTWAHTSGGFAGMTNAQFKELVEDTFNNRIAGRYANQVEIVAAVEYTQADVARGYSYQLNITVRGAVSRTVGVVNLTARRFED